MFEGARRRAPAPRQAASQSLYPILPSSGVPELGLTLEKLPLRLRRRRSPSPFAALSAITPGTTRGGLPAFPRALIVGGGDPKPRRIEPICPEPPQPDSGTPPPGSGPLMDKLTARRLIRPRTAFRSDTSSVSVSSVSSGGNEAWVGDGLERGSDMSVDGASQGVCGDVE